MSHTRAVPSKEAVTIRLPSGLNLALLTLAECPLSSATSLPEVSHTRAVLSLDAVTISLPSALKTGTVDTVILLPFEFC
jgi:hypothetical protein